MDSELEYDSSNDGSFNDDDPSNILQNLPSKNFVEEIDSFVTCSKLSNKTDDNEIALELNQEMQNMLEELKIELKVLLNKCRVKYKQNEIILNSSSKITTNFVKSFAKSYKFCGIPFFKTDQNYTCPPNDDYLDRKKNYNEMFAADFLVSKQNYWCLKDKVGIIQGVKSQVVEHISSKMRNTPSTSNINSNNSEENKKSLSSEYLSNLMFQCDKNFKISWYRISSEYVKHRFSENTCEAMWNLYLKPGLNREPWTNEENIILQQSALNHTFQNWATIAEEVGKRSEFQCFVQYIAVLAHQKVGNNKIIKWTPKDDEKLLKVVQKYRESNRIRWGRVKQHFPNLTKKQLHCRYHYSIDPNINKSRFTREEDFGILAAIEKYGENFQQFPHGLFPGRTIIQIRNRWHNTLKYSGKHSSWSLEDDKKLMELVNEHGVGNWSVISSKLINKSRSSTRQRYIIIKKFFEKNPESKLEKCPRKQRSLNTDISLENWQEKLALKMQKNEAEESEKALLQSKNYYNKLRCLEKQYYQFFKFSYDYTYNSEYSPIYDPITNLNFLMNLFKVNINTSLIKKTELYETEEYATIKKLINLRKINENCKTVENIRLPPNWSTLLGFRGICIQCAATIHTPPKVKYTKQIKDTLKGNIAKDLFRKRFYMLFYRTALLSRLENFFIPHEILLANSNVLQNLANMTNEQEKLPKKRRMSLSELDEKSSIKRIKEEDTTDMF